MDIVEFLTARYDEDEAAALATRQASYSWQNFDADGELRDSVNAGTIARIPADEDRAHIARHDPARVLADIAAKRRHIQMWREVNSELRRRLEVVNTTDPDNLVRANIDYYAALGMQQVVHDLLMLDFSLYAEHPDYAAAKEFGLSTLTKEERDA